MNEFIKIDNRPKGMVGVRRYFGLSKLATACYEKLWNHGHYLSAAELAAKVGCRPSNAYRALHQLETCGLVRSSKVPNYESTNYLALRVEDAFDTYRERMWHDLVPVMQAQRRQRSLDKERRWYL